MTIKKVRTSMEELSPIMLAMLDEKMDIKLTITGISMWPMLMHRRDSVVLTSCDKQGLKRGDLPLYKRASGQYVLHRIVKVNTDTYDLCGDNQCYIERGLPKDYVIAVVREFERNGKTWSCDSVLYKGYWQIRILSIPVRNFWNRGMGKIKRMLH